MARYIDADELIRLLEIDAVCQGDHFTKRDAIRCVKAINTADVAPKSEVERLETEVRLLTENSISAKYPCHVLCSKGLILTKSLEEYDKLLADISSEVAREIFEEIYEDCFDQFGYIDYEKLTDLKKKYEENNQ